MRIPEMGNYGLRILTIVILYLLNWCARSRITKKNLNQTRHFVVTIPEDKGITFAEMVVMLSLVGFQLPMQLEESLKIPIAQN